MVVITAHHQQIADGTHVLPIFEQVDQLFFAAFAEDVHTGVDHRCLKVALLAKLYIGHRGLYHPKRKGGNHNGGNDDQTEDGEYLQK